MNKIILIILLSVFGISGENIHTTFSCEFTLYSTPKGHFHNDTLKFTIITNDNNGTFTIKGSNGISLGTTIRGDKGLSFIEVTKTGNITTTTMTVVPPYGNKQTAVHSRNMLVNGKLLASQYYGTCQLIKGSKNKKVHIPISKITRYKIFEKLKLKKKLKTLSKNDTKYIFSALEGVFPSKKEMLNNMSIEGMLIVSNIMDEAMKELK